MGTFTDTLRAMLTERGLSQAELARRVGVSAQAVSGWFAAGNTPSRENVERIESALAVEPRGSLVTLAGYAAPADGGEHTVESLIRADTGLAEEDKQVLLRVILLARERHERARRVVSSAEEFAAMEEMANANRRRRVRSG